MVRLHEETVDVGGDNLHTLGMTERASRRRHEAAEASTRFDDLLALQLLKRMSHRVGIEDELRRKFAHGRQSIPFAQRARRHHLLDLVDDLLIKRPARRRLQPNNHTYLEPVHILLY